MGSFGIVNYTYQKKMIKFKDNSYCLALQNCPKRRVVCGNVNLMAVIKKILWVMMISNVGKQILISIEFL